MPIKSEIQRNFGGVNCGNLFTLEGVHISEVFS